MKKINPVPFAVHGLRLAGVIALVLLVTTPTSLARAGTSMGPIMCACPSGGHKPLGSNSSCEEACYGSSGGRNRAPAYDYEAERRRQEAERSRLEADVERRYQEEARRKQEEAERQAQFESEKREAAATLKGLPGSGNSSLKSSSTTNPYGLKGLDDVGRQLKSTDHHGRQAKEQDKDAGRHEAGKGFDTGGKESGGLVYPDKKPSTPAWSSALARKVPEGARKDPQIQQMIAWDESLGVRKKELEKNIAELKQQQKSSSDPLLNVKIETYNNELKQTNANQVLAQKKVKERVLDLGLSFDEGTSDTQGKGKK